MRTLCVPFLCPVGSVFGTHVTWWPWWMMTDEDGYVSSRPTRARTQGLRNYQSSLKPIYFLSGCGSNRRGQLTTGIIPSMNADILLCSHNPRRRWRRSANLPFVSMKVDWTFIHHRKVGICRMLEENIDDRTDYWKRKVQSLFPHLHRHFLSAKVKIFDANELLVMLA